MTDWLSYFDRLAKEVAKQRPDPDTKVGALLISRENHAIIGTAFNGLPSGTRHEARRLMRPTKYDYMCHAEMNLIAFAARNAVSTENRMLYCTHKPCLICTRLIIQAGISAVYFGDGVHSDESEFHKCEQLFSEAKVVVVGDST